MRSARGERALLEVQDGLKTVLEALRLSSEEVYRSTEGEAAQRVEIKRLVREALDKASAT